MPFTSGEQHKQLMEGFRNGATFIGLLRDRGAGMVVVDDAGQAVPLYSLTDELDVRNTKRAIEAQIRLHHAAGAREIAALAGGLPRWGAGQDLEAFIERCQRVPLRAGGFRLFAAHQMGTCRMGADPATQRRQPVGRAARHAGRLDRRRERLPDVLRHQSDDHRHGPGAPHRRGDRGRRTGSQRHAR